jgi:hypothetical protein
MKTKIILSYIIAVTLSLTLVGCGLIGSLRTNKTEISSNLGEELPEWLTVAHRVQAAEKPQADAVGDVSENDDLAPIVNRPASTQTGSTQPTQQVEQPVPTSGTPRWKQPGTMEYIAKQQLDQIAFNYKRLNTTIVDLEDKKDKNETEVADLKAKKLDRKNLYETMSDVAVGIGLSLEKEYGIKPPPVEVTETPTDSTWFQNWEQSPSGFGN